MISISDFYLSFICLFIDVLDLSQDISFIKVEE